VFDYYTHVQSLSEGDLVTEIEKLTKRMIATSPSSPIFSQLESYLAMARDAYNDILYTQRIKNESTVMEIGEIESIESTPDYSKEELLNIMVTSYYKSTPNKGKK
jgi:uncharacterized protein (DUF2252 family)